MPGFNFHNFLICSAIFSELNDLSEAYEKLLTGAGETENDFQGRFTLPPAPRKRFPGAVDTTTRP